MSARRRTSETWRAWLVTLLVLLGLVAAPSSARADDAAVMAPRDAPVVLDASKVHIPAVPATYVSKDVGGWLRLRYVPNAQERVEPILANAESMKARLGDTLGKPVLADVEVRIARTPEEMATLAPDGMPPPAYATGVAYRGLGLVLLTLSPPDPRADAPNIEEVLYHELAHVALDDATLGHHVPRWFNEGFAVWASHENPYARTKTLWDATLSKTIIPLSDLDRGFPEDNYEVSIAYAESADFVRFLLRDGDEARFASTVERVRAGTAFDRALSDAYGTDLRKLEFQWREEIAKRYTFLPMLTGGSFLWVIVFFGLVIGYTKKRRRTKATLARWAAEEAAVDAAMAAAAARATLAAMDDDRAVPGDPALRPSRTSEVPKIRHDGGWYTVH